MSRLLKSPLKIREEPPAWRLFSQAFGSPHSGVKLIVGFTIPAGCVSRAENALYILLSFILPDILVKFPALAWPAITDQPSVKFRGMC